MKCRGDRGILSGKNSLLLTSCSHACCTVKYDVGDSNRSWGGVLTKSWGYVREFHVAVMVVVAVGDGMPSSRQFITGLCVRCAGKSSRRSISRSLKVSSTSTHC